MTTAFDRLADAIRRYGSTLVEHAWNDWLEARDDATPPAPGPRNCVTVLVTNRAGQVLLICSGKEGRDWELPGGGMKLGETPPEAAAREGLEEAGVVIEVEPLFSVRRGQSVEGAAYPSLIYVVRGRAEGLPVAGSDAIDAGWFWPHALPTELSPLESLKVLLEWAATRSPLPRCSRCAKRDAEFGGLCPECDADDHGDRPALEAAKAAHVITNGKADRPGSGLFGRLTGEELQAAHAAHYAKLDSTLPVDYAARRAQGETGHGMVLTEPCAGCQKVARHPGEGYRCALHPSVDTDLARALDREAEMDEQALGTCNDCHEAPATKGTDEHGKFCADCAPAELR